MFFPQVSTSLPRPLQPFFCVRKIFLLNRVYEETLRPRDREREAPSNAGEIASDEKENDTPYMMHQENDGR